MVEIVLHRVPGSDIESDRILGGQIALAASIYSAVSEEAAGVTPELLFDEIAKRHPDSQEGLPTQFFLALTVLIRGGFISTAVRQVANA